MRKVLNIHSDFWIKISLWFLLLSAIIIFSTLSCGTSYQVSTPTPIIIYVTPAATPIPFSPPVPISVPISSPIITHLSTPYLTPKPTTPVPTPIAIPRDKSALIAFATSVAPLLTRYEQLGNEWNNWLNNASQIELQSNLISKAQYMDTELSKVHDRLLKLAAPQEWVNFKDLFSSTIAKNIEYFGYTQEYARTRNETYRIQSDSSTMEAKKLYSLAADEWDRVMATYKLR